MKNGSLIEVLQMIRTKHDSRTCAKHS